MINLITKLLIYMILKGFLNDYDQPLECQEFIINAIFTASSDKYWGTCKWIFFVK